MYAFIDDSGDAGMKFKRGSSTHLVLSMCLFQSEQAWKSTETALRDLPDYMKTVGEFKHSKMKDRHKEAFFKQIENEDFYVRAIIVDKTKLTSQFLASHANEMKTYFLMQLLTHTWGQVQDCKIVIDGADLQAFGMKSTDYLFEKANENRKIRVASEVICADSKDSLGLQLADMVAGTVMAGLKKGQPMLDTDRWLQVRRRMRQPQGSQWFFMTRLGQSK